MRKLLALSFVLVLVDQATKLAVKGFNLFGVHHQGMYLSESFSVIGDFLRITFVENPGMAFGLNLGLPYLLGLFSIGAAVFIVYLLRKSTVGKIGGFHVSLAMILGGAVGNLIDRVFYGLFYGYGGLFEGKVVDFIDVDIPDISLFGKMLDRFYVFNIADSAVSVGIVLLLIFYPKQQREEERRKAAANPDLHENSSSDHPLVASTLSSEADSKDAGNVALASNEPKSVEDGSAPTDKPDTTSNPDHSTGSSDVKGNQDPPSDSQESKSGLD